jgi:hypothetical protein
LVVDLTKRNSGGDLRFVVKKQDGRYSDPRSRQCRMVDSECKESDWPMVLDPVRQPS